MNSSLAALIAPSSGVAQAVSGYLVGMGDGVTTVFTAPPEITSISALYRRDWQGTVALSASARTNRCLYSEGDPNWKGEGSNPPTVNSTSIVVDGVTCTSTTFPTVSNGSYSVSRVTGTANSTMFTAGLWMVHSSWLKLSRPLVGGESLTIVATGASCLIGFIINSTNSALFTSWARLVSESTRISVTGGGFYVIYSVDLLTPVTVYSSRRQVEVGLSATPYIGPTTTAPVTVTDYVASGNTITLAEAPVRAAEISLDGTATGLPLIQIR